MKKFRIDAAVRRHFEYDLFRGGDVMHQPLVEAETLDGAAPTVRVQIVAFPAGAYTRLHVHTVDQVLVVTEGEGRIGTLHEDHTVTPGDVLYIAAGEPHYHGATADTAMAHLSILTPGNSYAVDEPWTWPG